LSFAQYFVISPQILRINNNNTSNTTEKSMKKYTMICAALCAALMFTGCKSSESAYKQAYLKAKQQEELQQKQEAEAQAKAQQAAQEQENNVVVPMEEKPVNETQVVDNADNVPVRQETVSVVAGAGLKNFSVVVGSFSLKANAAGLQQTLNNQGYNAQVVVNNQVSPAMYRVVATTFDSKSEAAASRNALQEKYPGAWLLYAK
jgi:cell division septation protein DedD